jgi:phosphoheptose isomerase
METEAFIKTSLDDSAEAMVQLSKSTELKTSIALAIHKIAESYRHAGRLFIAGNGGSAAEPSISQRKWSESSIKIEPPCQLLQ